MQEFYVLFVRYLDLELDYNLSTHNKRLIIHKKKHKHLLIICMKVSSLERSVFSVSCKFITRLFTNA